MSLLAVSAARVRDTGRVWEEVRELAVEGIEVQADAVGQTWKNAQVGQLTGGEAAAATETVLEAVCEFPSVRRGPLPAYSEYEHGCAEALLRAVVVGQRNAKCQSLFRRDRARAR